MMQCKNAPDSFRPRGTWLVVESMKTLGQVVTYDGSAWDCVHAAINQMWAAFYANLCDGLLASPTQVRFAFVRNSLMSIMSWRWARWPYQKCIAMKLDSVQAHFLQILFPVIPIPEESADAFFGRKRLQAGRLATKMGRFSAFWAGSTKSWNNHLCNADFERSWSSQINSVMSFNRLENLRIANSRAGKRDRTGTRATNGHVHTRWCEGLEAARAIPSLKCALPAKTRIFGS